jgi:AcrR family transcriptional regulator
VDWLDLQKRGRGRPSTFDRAVVLREAMKLFWENGYEGTSFDDLISKMSMSPSSFYNAFGSKERLYRKATEFFMDDAQKWIQGALSKEGATTRESFTHLLESVAIEFTREDLPRGCMISLSGTQQGPDLAPIRDMMTEYRAASEVYLAARNRKTHPGWRCAWRYRRRHAGRLRQRDHPRPGRPSV